MREWVIILRERAIEVTRHPERGIRVDEGRLILSRKEIRTLRALKGLLPNIGKFNQVEFSAVMKALKNEAGIKNEEEAKRIMASLESHFLATCNIFLSTPTYSTQTAPSKILFKGCVTSKGVQYLRREGSYLVLVLSAALYVAIGAFLLVIVSQITGVTDIISAIWMGGLAGFGLKVYGTVEGIIQSRLVVE